MCVCVCVCVCAYTMYSGTSLIRTPMGQKKCRGVLISEVEMHARVVLGVGKGVLFLERCLQFI